MNAEFNWWLLIVGLVIGAGLVWVILADSARRDADITTDERPLEARWIAEALARGGRPIEVDDVHEVLDLHDAYRSLPPPDSLTFDGDSEPDDDRSAAALPARPVIPHPTTDRDPDGDRQPV